MQNALVLGQVEIQVHQISYGFDDDSLTPGGLFNTLGAASSESGLSSTGTLLVFDFTNSQLSTLEVASAARAVTIAIEAADLFAVLILDPKVEFLVPVINATTPRVETYLFRDDEQEKANVKHYRNHSLSDPVYSRQNLVAFIRRNLAKAQLPPAERELFLEAWLRASEWAVSTSEGSNIETMLQLKTLPVPLCIHRRPESNTLTVWLNGAINPEWAKGEPVYQRRSWWPSVDGSHLSVPDPTQSVYGKLGLTWGSGTREHWAIPAQAGAIAGIHSALQLQKFNKYRDATIRLRLYGTSAGGFQALAISTFIHTDELVVNNPQVDWRNWSYPKFVTEVCETIYGVANADAINLDKYGHRISVIELWRKVGFVPPFQVLINLNSEYDVDEVAIPLTQMLSKNSGLRSLAFNSSIHFYSSPSDGHAPLLPEEAFGFLRRIRPLST